MHTHARIQENGAEETTREVFSKQAFLCTKYNIVFRAMPIHEMELISSLLFFVSLRGCYLSDYQLFFLAPSFFVFAVYCSSVFACECWQVVNRMRRAKHLLSFLAKKESVMGLDLRPIQDRQITIAFQLHVFKIFHISNSYLANTIPKNRRKYVEMFPSKHLFI